jgi:hypothetical protein
LAETTQPPPPPPPAFELIYKGAIGQPGWTTSLCNPSSLNATETMSISQNQRQQSRIISKCSEKASYFKIININKKRFALGFYCPALFLHQLQMKNARLPFCFLTI